MLLFLFIAVYTVAYTRVKKNCLQEHMYVKWPRALTNLATTLVIMHAYNVCYPRAHLFMGTFLRFEYGVFFLYKYKICELIFLQYAYLLKHKQLIYMERKKEKSRQAITIFETRE